MCIFGESGGYLQKGTFSSVTQPPFPLGTVDIDTLCLPGCSRCFLYRTLSLQGARADVKLHLCPTGMPFQYRPRPTTPAQAVPAQQEVASGCQDCKDCRKALDEALSAQKQLQEALGEAKAAQSEATLSLALLPLTPSPLISLCLIFRVLLPRFSGLGAQLPVNRTFLAGFGVLECFGHTGMWIALGWSGEAVLVWPRATA